MRHVLTCEPQIISGKSEKSACLTAPDALNKEYTLDLTFPGLHLPVYFLVVHQSYQLSCLIDRKSIPVYCSIKKVINAERFFIKECKNKIVPFLICINHIFFSCLDINILFLHHIFHPPVERCNKSYMQRICNFFSYRDTA